MANNPAYFLNTSLAVPGAQLRVSSTTLDFIQSAYNTQTSVLAQSLIGYMSNLPNPDVYIGGDLSGPYVLSGMKTFTIFGIPVSPLGYIWYNGSIYQATVAPGLTYPTGFTSSLYATFSTVNNFSSYGNNADPASFTNGSLANVHNITTIQFGTNSAGALFPYSALQFMTPVPEQISNAITPVQTQVTTLSSIPAWETFTSVGITLGTGWSLAAAGDTPRITKDSLGRVYFQGLLSFGGSSGNTTVFTMPSGYYCTEIVVNPIAYTTGGTTGMVNISISNGAGSGGGIVAIAASTVPSGLAYLYLSAIMYITL